MDRDAFYSATTIAIIVRSAPPNISPIVGSPTPALGRVTGVGEVLVFVPPTFPVAVALGVPVPPV